MRACAMRVSGIRLTFLDWDPWIRGGVNPGILRFSASTLEIFEKNSQTAPHWRFFLEFSKILVQGNFGPPIPKGLSQVFLQSIGGGGEGGGDM